MTRRPSFLQIGVILVGAALTIVWGAALALGLW